MAGCEAASLAATALATRPAPSGPPHDTHRADPAILATTRRPTKRAVDPMARRRDKAPSGHDEAQIPQAGQAEGSNSSTSAPRAGPSGPEIAPVGQAVRQTLHPEQWATSITTSPSGATGEASSQCAGEPASADIARTVAAGSRSSTRDSGRAGRFSPARVPRPSRALGPSPGTTTSPRRPGATLPTTSLHNRASSRPRPRHASSPQPRTVTAAPAATIWSSHPAVTISSEGTSRASHGPPSVTLSAAWEQTMATPRPSLRASSTSTPAAASSSATEAALNEIASDRQAATHAPHPEHEAASMEMSGPATDNAWCRQACAHERNAPPHSQRSAVQAATGR